MAAQVMQLLDDLEARLEHAQHEINVLREENQRLRQKLGEQGGREEQSTREEALPPLQTMPPEPDASSEPPAAEAPKPPSPHALLNQWYERYPDAFFKGHTKPLKVGIHQDLAEREPWSNKLIRRALANYVNLPRYVKAMREGATRVDLAGNPSGVVDQQAAQFAAEKRKLSAPADKKAPQKNSQAAGAEKTPSKNKRPEHARKKRQKSQRVERQEKDQQVGKRELTLEEKLASLQAKFQRP
ncbi:ABC transporter substrate-binding protein [Halomonas alkaliantarctica]|nr:ABC transporter substrate-binding protein [Halomonas alkaliantarctica]